MEMDSMSEKPSMVSMLPELKSLLGETGSNGLADRQKKIDELISKISELGD
jgi:hypothetical protein